MSEPATPSARALPDAKPLPDLKAALDANPSVFRMTEEQLRERRLVGSLLP